MAPSLRPYFQLLHSPSQTRTVDELRLELGTASFDALYQTGWLEPALPERRDLAVGDVAIADERTSLGFRQDEPGAVEGFGAPNEQLMLDAALSWLGLRARAPEGASIGRGLVLLTAAPWPVFFVRNLDLEMVKQLAELETHGPSLVLTTTRGPSLADFIVERYSGVSPVRLLFLEEFSEVRGEEAVFVRRPIQLFGSSDSGTPYDALLTTEGGCERITRVRLLELRAARGEYDLFVDFTIPAAGAAPGHYAGHVRRGSTLEEFRLSPFESAIFLEFVRAEGAALSVSGLKCVRELQIRSTLRKFRDMRKKVDPSEGRNQYRAFRGYRSQFGSTDRFVFSPPPGFRLAVLELPAL